MSWQRVRGHEPLVKSFADVVRRGRLGHAYLLVGPAGVGKKLFAREFAKALLCESAGKDFDACDRCASCVQIEAGTHPDVIFASLPEEKNEFPIDEIRDLTSKLALKPARGGYKVAIIDDVDSFNDQSANAFLKTLEEPPPQSVLFLIATDPERQLATIISRCQIVRFAPLPAALVADLLIEQGVEAEKARRRAQLGGGSAGQALDLAEEALWAFRAELLTVLRQPKPDTVRLAHEWVTFVEDAGKESSLHRRRAALVLKLLIDVLTSALAVASGGALERVEAEDRDTVKALAGRLGPDRLLQLIERCLEADHQIDRKVQLVLIVEALADSFS